MNCEQISELVGIQCEELESSSGEPILSIETPFALGNGNRVSIFVQQLKSKVRFFDAGETFFELINSGIDLSNKRRWTPLKNILTAHGITLLDSGEIELWADISKSPQAFAMLSASLMAIANWQIENAGATDDRLLLVEEVEPYLRVWKPGKIIEREPKFIGFSGVERQFAFKLDNEYIDVVGWSPNSSSAEVKKLLDIRSRPIYQDLNLKVVLDDRKDRERSKQEASLLGKFADVWMMTNLILTNPIHQH